MELIKPGEEIPVPQVLIQRLSDAMKEYPQAEQQLTHHYSHGVYGRELFIPKDTLLVGRVHKYSNMNVLLKGELTVTTEEGMRRVKAPFLVVSPPGTMRAAYAHEDSVWVTFLGTDCTDPDQIQEDFTFERFEQFLEFQNNQMIEGPT